MDHVGQHAYSRGSLIRSLPINIFKGWNKHMTQSVSSVGMPKKRHLLRNEVTYSDVKDEEFNILRQLGYHAEQSRFFAHLLDRRSWMQTVVAHHLNVSPAACHVAGIEEWLHGSFNVCVPIAIDTWNGKRALLRFPLPYRVGEAFRPGNGDEKIRCEAGTYAWLQENCAGVPIPRLYGFALSSGESV